MICGADSSVVGAGRGAGPAGVVEPITGWGSLAAALTEMFKYDKAAALGIASTPYGDNDPDGLSLQAAHNLIEGAIKGVQAR